MTSHHGILPQDEQRSRLIICVFLVVATLAAFWQATGCEFINYDDPSYVYGNPHVTTGLSFANIRWALTTTQMSNWHPLTWISHMADCQLYGLNPYGHHLTSVLLHVLNTVLLFLLLGRLTGSLYRSAFVAAMFALHPLHVESVAWVSERKDLLSALFFLLALFSYAVYVTKRGVAGYVAALCAFTFGLMAKPMIVTLPFLLFLVDWWPLGRFGKEPLRRLVLEKVPFLVLAACVSVITIYAQERSGALAHLEDLPVMARLANMSVNYGRYIVKTFWPHDLAFFYPLPRHVPAWQVVGATLLIVGISVPVFRLARRYPYLAVGWLWFIGGLIPAIGLVQVGIQSTADRYTYLPLVGIFVIIAWGLPELFKGARQSRTLLPVAAGVCLLALALCTYFQTCRWKDSITLYNYTLGVTRDNFTVHYNLGVYLAEKGRNDEAIHHFTEAVKIAPDFAEAHYNLGIVLAEKGRIEEAIRHFTKAVIIEPDLAEGHNSLAFHLDTMGRVEEAIYHYLQVVRIDPGNAEAHYRLAIDLAKKGRMNEAEKHRESAMRLNPAFRK